MPTKYELVINQRIEPDACGGAAFVARGRADGGVSAVGAESDRGVAEPLRTDPGAQPCGYPNDAIRLAISRAVAAETPRGWRIAKDKQSHKIDVVVALAMAALSALRSGADDYYSSLEWVASPAELGRTRRSLWEHPSILGW
jgi:hypothetical protein